ncbi:MAG: helix-turn-helix domain-containing protein [Chthonomonadales bacterium]|nr:helix-turn-helix domain-containing protein [Chthonomonadales bacterium]
MSVHRNAALSLVKRRDLVGYVAAGATLKAAAVAFNVGGNTVRRWWRRYLILGHGSARPRSLRHRSDGTQHGHAYWLLPRPPPGRPRCLRRPSWSV